MTAPQKRAVVTGVLTILLGAAVLTAARQTVLRPEYEAHVQMEAARFEAVLDILCTDHPTHRRCR